MLRLPAGRALDAVLRHGRRDRLGAELGRFEAVLAALPGAGWDAGTRAWFETSEPEALKAATTDPRDPAEVMADFVAFVRDLPAPRIFAAHPVAFDG